MKNPRIVLVASGQEETTPAVRKQLRAAMAEQGWMPTWEECLPGDAGLAVRFRSMPGPFVLAGGSLVEMDGQESMGRSLAGIASRSARWSWLRRPLAAGSVVPGILLAFFPKCAGCWAAYFSVFNSVGVGVPYMPWMKHVLAGTMVLSALYFVRMAKRRRRWVPFGFQMAGFAAVLLAQYAVRAPGLMWTGVGLVFAGSLLYAMPDAWMRRVERGFGIRWVVVE